MYIVHKDNKKAKEFIEFYNHYWSKCTELDKRNSSYFNIIENQVHLNNKLKVTKIEEEYIENKIDHITNKEIKRRFKICLSKDPYNIYIVL